MPAPVKLVKWISIGLTKKLSADILFYQRKNNITAIGDAIRKMMYSALEDGIVKQNMEMKELLSLIREGPTEDNQQDILSRVDRILEK